MRMQFLWLVFLFCPAAFADFEIYLKDANKIPLYPQETGYWCGAGSGQMVLEGFPDDVNFAYTQKKVWDEIQKVKVEKEWYTDPDGLKNVLTLLGKDSHWEAICLKTPAVLTKVVLDGMYLRRYPVPVLVYGHDHWVVVIGATTDEHPMLSATLKLKRIEAHDPWHAQHVLVDGSTWLNKYWNEKGTSGKWANCYVAVHEVEDRSESSNEEIRLLTEEHPTQGVPITPERARASAKASLAKIASERSDFRELSKAAFQDPMLVTHERGDYYLVPVGDSASGLSFGAVMVNAYSGQWEGLSRFQSPFRYRNHRQSGRWLFRPSRESRSPFHPVYQTSRGFLDFDGGFFEKLHEMGLGS